MWVVKLGGSLDAAGHLGDWARALAQVQVPMLVVPGGGPFANAVRGAQQRWQFDDRAAHLMAVLAMEQMAHLIRSLAPTLAGTDDVMGLAASSSDRAVRVWHPSRELVGGGWPDAGRIPCTWEVTSDSLAAIAAARVTATGLVLVKSAPLSPPAARVESLQSTGVLDPAFNDFGARCGCPVWLVGGSRPNVLFDLLNGYDRSALRVRFHPPAMSAVGRGACPATSPRGSAPLEDRKRA
jgi:aspartokinase-like uncharacterized kinase